MAKRNDIERLDEAVRAMMKHPVTPVPPLTPRLAALLRIASDLRDLPNETFRARLEAELRSATPGADVPRAVPASYGKPLLTEDDIEARLAEMADEPRMIDYDLGAALSDLPDRAMRFLAPLGECVLGVSRFSGSPHWERHPGGDEMLHLLEGEAEVVTLTDAGPVRSPLRAGSIFICPQGLWHQVRPRSIVSLFFATPGEGTEATTARPRGQRSAQGTERRRPDAPKLEAHDIRAALRALPELRIASGTTAAEADAAFGELATLNGRGLYAGRFHGQSPWERHSNGDELLHVLEGEIEVTVLTDGGTVERTLSAGSIFVCPRGLWHRQVARCGATGFYATPKPTEVSFAADPRLGG